MEDCQTPTLAQVMEFKYELTPTMVFDPSRLQDAQNLIVNRINVRCFTPTVKNFQSPGLSPINECAQTLLGGVAVGVAANMENRQKSMAMTAAVKDEYFKVPLKKSKNVQQKQTVAVQQQLQQQQQQQQKFTCHTHFVSDSPPVFTLNSTTTSDADFSIDDNSPDSSAILGYANNNNNNSSNDPNNSVSLNSSNNVTFTNSLNNYYNNNNNTSNALKNVSNTNLLNHTMNVSTLLRSVGLEQYIDLFEEQNMNLEQFLNIRLEDIQRLGVHILEHQKILIDLLNGLNGV
ncbi:homeobox protein 4 [Zeugodacus cucurbitae]|nr:homeobox protein 4 [Zeugodacus cucurbitae]